MTKLNYSQKKKLKKTLTVIGVILAVALVIGLIVSLVNKPEDDYEKINLTWTVGGINLDTNKFDPDMKDCMTSQRIKIEDGFKVVPDYHAGMTIDVVFFDDSDRFISCETSNAIINSGLTDTADATYYRIVIHPNDEDGEINWFESFKYANQIEAFRYVGETDTTEE